MFEFYKLEKHVHFKPGVSTYIVHNNRIKSPQGIVYDKYFKKEV